MNEEKMRQAYWFSGEPTVKFEATSLSGSEAIKNNLPAPVTQRLDQAGYAAIGSRDGGTEEMKSVIQSVCWFLSPLALIGWIYALTKAAMYLSGLPAYPSVFFALIMTGTQFGVLIYVQGIGGSLTQQKEETRNDHEN